LIFLVVLIFVSCSEKEVIGAALGAKMPTRKEIATVFTYFIETNRAFVHPALFFRNLAFHTVSRDGHDLLIINELSLTIGMKDT